MADEQARQAMHVLLDMVASQDLDATEEENETAARTAFQRLHEVEAIRVSYDDETGTTVIDPTPLVTAAGMAVDTLLRQLANKIGHDRLAILNVLREHLDGLLQDPE